MKIVGFSHPGGQIIGSLLVEDIDPAAIYTQLLPQVRAQTGIKTPISVHCYVLSKDEERQIRAGLAAQAKRPS